MQVTLCALFEQAEYGDYRSPPLGTAEQQQHRNGAPAGVSGGGGGGGGRWPPTKSAASNGGSNGMNGHLVLVNGQRERPAPAPSSAPGVEGALAADASSGDGVGVGGGGVGAEGEEEEGSGARSVVDYMLTARVLPRELREWLTPEEIAARHAMLAGLGRREARLSALHLLMQCPFAGATMFAVTVREEEEYDACALCTRQTRTTCSLLLSNVHVLVFVYFVAYMAIYSNHSKRTRCSRAATSWPCRRMAST